MTGEEGGRRPWDRRSPLAGKGEATLPRTYSPIFALTTKY